ncbi:ATPase domain-containing protein [Sorangium sp. So ce542]|uniref:ATPase domain-containing protein n=1 Tax=Sorangium sp. So ce542 TaxID=3133316 RepID=UPI003F5D7F55
MGRQPNHPTELRDEQASSGVEGLDEILRGGFPRGEVHLVQGGSGTGKTTLVLQFLLAGERAGESGLYITLAQTKRGLEAIARSHGWSLEGVAVHDLSLGDIADQLAPEQTVLHTAEVELGELTRRLRQAVEDARPRRVVLDSIGVLGLLAGSRSRFHREIVALRQFLAGYGCTALFVGEGPLEPELDSVGNTEFYSLAGGVIHLEQRAPDYGEVRRRLRVLKVRSVPFQGGYHDFRIQTGGIVVYPRLGMRHSEEYDEFRQIRSGLGPLDDLLGGGLEHGTTCLFIGPAGSGKSTLATIYAEAAARAGVGGAVFLLEERPETFMARSTNVGLDVQPYLDSGRLTIEQVRTAEITPGEFAHKVRAAVEDRRARLIVIDSLMGYFMAMADTSMLQVQMYELLHFLNRSGVLTILVTSHEWLMGIGSRQPVDVSYLSDAIILLQMFESDGRIRRCLTAVKKRQGEHDTTIRELSITPGGVQVGEEPLRYLQSILSGNAVPADRDRRRDGGGRKARGEEDGGGG